MCCLCVLAAGAGALAQPELGHCLQGDVYKFLQQQGGKEGRLGEEVVVPLVLEPFMQALQYIHEWVRAWLHSTAAAL